MLASGDTITVRGPGDLLTALRTVRPDCFKCLAPTDGAQVMVDRREVVMRARCHGAFEEVRIPSAVLAEAHTVEIGLAFRPSVSLARRAPV